MNDVARRARLTRLVALGGLLLVAACATLALRTWSPASHHSTAKPVTLDLASLPSTARALPTTRPPRTVVSPDGRQGINPADLHLLPSEPLTPPEVVVDAEIATSRGVMTVEPLTPPVVRVDAEIAPRGVMTAEPLTPPVVHVEVE